MHEMKKRQWAAMIALMLFVALCAYALGVGMHCGR